MKSTSPFCEKNVCLSLTLIASLAGCTTESYLPEPGGGACPATLPQISLSAAEVKTTDLGTTRLKIAAPKSDIDPVSDVQIKLETGLAPFQQGFFPGTFPFQAVAPNAECDGGTEAICVEAEFKVAGGSEYGYRAASGVLVVHAIDPNGSVGSQIAVEVRSLVWAAPYIEDVGAGDLSFVRSCQMTVQDIRGNGIVAPKG